MGIGYTMKGENMKGGKDMEVIIEERKAYLDRCPYCGEQIKGYSASAMKYNMGIHIDKHVRNGDELPNKKQ